MSGITLSPSDVSGHQAGNARAREAEILLEPRDYMGDRRLGEPRDSAPFVRERVRAAVLEKTSYFFIFISCPLALSMAWYYNPKVLFNFIMICL
jgi:hypothetical protein